MGIYDPLYEAAGKEFGVDPVLIKAHALQESGENPAAGDDTGDGANSAGIGQFIPQTWASVTGGTPLADRLNPAVAIPMMAKFIRHNLDTHSGDVTAATAAYNGSGPAAAAYADKIGGIYRKLRGQQVASTQPTDPDEAAGDAYVRSITSQGSAPAVLAKLRAQQAAPAAPTDPDEAAGAAYIQSLTAPPPAATPATVPGDAGAPAAAPPPSADASITATHPLDQASIQIPALHALGAGATQGVGDVLGAAANGINFMDRNLPVLGRMDSWLGRTFPSSVDPQAAGNALNMNRQAFDASPEGNSLAGSIGRVGGQTLATLPVLGPMGEALGAGVNALAAGARGVSPLLGMAARGAGLVGSGAVEGGTAAALTSGQSDAPLADQMRIGAEGGAALGPVAGLIGAGANMLTGTVGATRARLADLAVNKYGLPISADQISESPLAQKAGQMLRQMPLSGMKQADLQTPFNRAVGNTFGADLSASDGKFTPAVMQAAKDKLGQQFDAIASRTTIQPDSQFLTDLGQIEADARKTLNQPDSNRISGQVGDMLDAAVKNNGVIPGDVYQAITRKGAPLDRLSSSDDPNVAHYAQGVREALDDAFQRSAGQADQAALSATRFQYKNLKTVEPLVAKSANGDVSPLLLNGAVTGSFKNRAMQGAGDLGELAQVGQTFLKGPRDSGTPAGMNMVRMLSLGGGGGSAAAGLAGLTGHLDPATAAISAGTGLAGLGAQRLLSSHYQNPAVINRLIQSGLPGPRAAKSLGSALSGTSTNTGAQNALQQYLLARQGNALVPSQ